MVGKFLYFAYGSNLLEQRIHINNPTAVRHGIGKLQDYQLDFVTYSKIWKGASATIVPKKDSHVWGALWEIDMVDMEHLDNQEGVSHKIYFPLTVEVETPIGKKLNCRVYIQTAKVPDVVPLEDLPPERKPSAVYINTMLKGAKESGLPGEYQEFLGRVAHNGYNGEIDIGTQLNLK
ncbi:gamma-glutamylcyclotransferase-like isoform X2 [Anoplophora glabripennis]|nr:gamma-glutamylcyclotransferase-like isoform X2 [Anoplophora glabripennis]